MTGDQTYMISSLNMKRSLVLITAMLLLASCTSELDQSLNGNRAVLSKQRTLFHATIEASPNPDTKVYADDQLRVLWNKNDNISIFNKNTGNLLYGFEGEEGDNAGEFSYVSGDATSTAINNIYAVYPYSESTSISNDGVLSLTLPASQTYKESSFGIGANTMIARTTDRLLSFKNVGGYLAVRLYGDNIYVSRITLKGNNGEKLAGKASIGIPLGGTPTVTMDESSTDAVSIVCDPSVKIGTDAENYTEFWFVIPPVTFEKGFTITVTDALGGTFHKKSSNSISITRNNLSRMEPIVVPNKDKVFVPFDDEQFKSYCVSNYDGCIDGNRDGEISLREAQKVTRLSLGNRKISSFKGMDYFTELTEFSYSGDILYKLTSINLSKNTALKYLYLENNKLTTLDLSNNTALITVDCHGNQLTNLKLGDNTALTRLDCSYNKLQLLNVDGCTALAQFYCYQNQLTSIDVSHNVALTDFQCSFNQLTSLDVSNIPGLEYLICNDNPLLTEIWLKTGQSIRWFNYDTEVATIKYK